MGLLAPLLLAAGVQANPTHGVAWHWDREWPGCGLIQDVDDRTVFEIERTPGNDQTGIEIKPPKPILSVQRTSHGGILSFRPGGAAIAEITVYEGYDGRRHIKALARSPDVLDKFGNSTGLDFAHEKAGELRIPILAAGAAVQALRVCEDGKMREWGVDAVAWHALAVKPKPVTPQEKWFSYLDYPDRENIYKDDITVVARIDLGADGSIQNCTVVNNPPAEFVAPVCKGLKRAAKLEPARDAAGQGTPAPYVVMVTFGAFPL